MATWGVKLFENDLTQDIKVSIEEALGLKISVKDIIRDLKVNQSFNELSNEEQLIFWIASSMTIWNNGYKDSDLFSKGLKSIDIFMSNYLISEELKNELNDCQKKLHESPPKIRKKSDYYVCPWKIGDVYALPIENDNDKNNSLNGRYFIFIKRDESTFKGNIYPIVEVKITNDKVLPKTEQEIINLETMTVDKLKPEYHIMISHLDNENTKHYVDKDGMYPLKYYKISGISVNDIPKKILFIGNHPDIDISSDTNYYQPEHKWLYSGKHWKDTENDLIKRYYNLNVSKLKINI